MQTTTVPTLPSIKFLLESSVEMFNGVNGGKSTFEVTDDDQQDFRDTILYGRRSLGKSKLDMKFRVITVSTISTISTIESAAEISLPPF
ncbi:2647_t:CDS:2 [Rhizophagus irregularis]|nr:2647_t:CDS:2 [Rhizophagus irregularis]